MINELNLLELFIENLLSEKGLAKNTILAYMRDLKDFFIYYNRSDISIKNLDPAVLSSYITKLSKDNLAASSLARKISCLRQFYKFLLSEKIIDINPALELEHPKKQQSLPKSISQNEVNSLFEAAYKDETPEGIRNSAILEILYSTGMRISELITLKINWLLNPVDSGDGYKAFSIVGKGGKERLIIINHQALTVLNNYLETRHWFIKNGVESTFLFPSYKKNGKETHLSRQMCFYILKALAAKAGLDAKIISPHKIRHSFASHILQRGASLRIVQDLMGHADITSTQIYTKVLSEQAKNLVFDQHPLTNEKHNDID